jgi:lipoate-protein ligase A
MLSLEVLAQGDLDPAVSQALDRDLLDAAACEPHRARLRVYRLAGDVLSLGRYHLAPATAPAGGVRLHRRLGGGRVLPLGAGFAVVSLLLPHRSALVGDDPLALRPEQVLGRCVRALLGALRRLGLDAFYPGRDRLTAAGRMLGVVSLETNAQGATAFEAVLALRDDWTRLADLVASADREGILAAELVAPEQVTSLAAHGVVADIDQLAAALVDALHAQFGVQPTRCQPPASPSDAPARAEAWIAARRRRAALDRHAVEWGQLGVLDVYLAVRGGHIEDVLLAGDFIADSPSIERLEQRLRGCPQERGEIAAIVDDVYADPRSFLLGLGPLANVADAIARAR